MLKTACIIATFASDNLRSCHKNHKLLLNVHEQGARTCIAPSMMIQYFDMENDGE